MRQLIIIFLLSIPFDFIFSQSEIIKVDIWDTIQISLPKIIADDTSYARILYLQSDEYIGDKNYTLAYQKADTARHIYTNFLGENNIEVSDCMLMMGMALYFKYDYRKSINILEKAIQININIGQKYTKSSSIGYSYLGLNNYKLSNYEKAIEFQKCNLDIRLKIYGEENFNLAATYHQIGNIYIRKGDYHEALIYHNQALKIRTIHKRGLMASFQSLALAYKYIGDYKTAIDYNLRALQMALKVVGESHLDIALLYNNLANCYKAYNEIEKAIEYNFKALGIYTKLLPEYHSDIAMSYSNLGNCYREKGDFNKALLFQNQALQTCLRSLDHDQIKIANIYNNIFSIYYETGDHVQALEFLNKSLNLLVNVFGENHLRIAHIYINKGLLFTANNDLERGMEYYLKAYDIYSKSNEFHSLANLYYNIGVNFFKRCDYDNAILNFQTSIEYFSKFKDNIPTLSLKVYNSLIASYIQVNNLDLAKTYCDRAVDIIKRQIFTDYSTDSKIYFQAQNIPLFEKAISLSLMRFERYGDKNTLSEIFTFSEMAKALILQNQIKQNDAITFSGVPDSLINKEKEIRLTINYREKQLRDLIDSGANETDSEIMRLSSIIFDLKRSQEELFLYLEEEFPDYYRIRYDISTINLEETQQKLLNSDQSLLEYFVGDSSITIIVVTRDTFAVHSLKKDFSLSSLVQELQFGIYGYYSNSIVEQSVDLYKSTVKSYNKAAQELYTKLVYPICHLLTQEVIVVPDAELSYVPFEVLLKDEAKKLGHFKSYPFLMKEHNISYSYSATMLKEMKNKKHKKNPENSLIAFAPFYAGSYEMLDSILTIAEDKTMNGASNTMFEKVVLRKSFSQLPSSGEEVKSAAKIMDGEYYINEEASRQSFIDKSSNYRILHLATHGSANGKDGKYSYLAFTNEISENEDQFLYVRDLYNLNLNAELVVLSACETALGEIQRGEGVVSLARGFAFAGAKSILTTLWTVDDTVTKEIIKEFYIYLKKGRDKNTALRNAKINHLKVAKARHQHPFFWAGFIGIGDMSAIKN